MEINGINAPSPSLPEVYKRKIAQQLGTVSMTKETRDSINALVSEALDNMMPSEKVEETKVEEDNVACKLLLKGQPNSLFRAIEPIIKSLTVYTKNGSVDMANTPEYILTMMLEKVKKD